MFFDCGSKPESLEKTLIDTEKTCKFQQCLTPILGLSPRPHDSLKRQLPTGPPSPNWFLFPALMVPQSWSLPPDLSVWCPNVFHVLYAVLVILPTHTTTHIYTHRGRQAALCCCHRTWVKSFTSSKQNDIGVQVCSFWDHIHTGIPHTEYASYEHFHTHQWWTEL